MNHRSGASSPLRGRFRVARVLFVAALIAVSMLSVSPSPTRAAGSVPNTALILGTSITPASCDPTEAGGACSAGQSLEEQQAQLLGFKTTVVTAAQWASFTASDFAAFQVIIIGDPTCVGGGDAAPSFAPAAANASVWEPVVMNSGGNRVVIGTDPTFHNQFGGGGGFHNGGEKLEKGGIGFAGLQTGATGAYVDLSCAYSAGFTDKPVPLLDGLSVAGAGQFAVDSAPCAGAISIVASSGPTAGLHDTDLGGWSCSVHESFRKFGPDYTPLAIATDPSLPSHPFCADDVDTGALACGEPYVLASGSGIVVKSELSLTPPTQTNPVGTTATLTATVLKGGSPESGKTVSFIVSAGPDAGLTGSGVTTSAGKTTFSIKGTTVGTDTVTGSFTSDTGALETATATVTFTTATAAPSCALTAMIAGPPKQIQITVQDTGSGLKSVVVTESVNATVDVPTFTVGTTSKVVVTATKVDQSAGSTVALAVTNVAGAVTTCDPTLVTVGAEPGVPHVQKIRHVSSGESRLTISNGTPGLTELAVVVDGQRVEVRDLNDGAKRIVDLSALMHRGSNDVMIIAQGRSKGTATLLLSN